MTIAADKSSYQRGETVVLSGTAQRLDGSNLVNQQVTLQLQNAGMERTFQATTDSAGHFAYAFQPLAGEGGDYVVTASATRAGIVRTAQAAFDIQGILVSLPADAAMVLKGDVAQYTVQLQNVGSIEQTGVTLEVVDLNTGDAVDAIVDPASVPTTIGPGATWPVTITFQAGASTMATTAAFTVVVRSDQTGVVGATQADINVQVEAPAPKYGIDCPEIKVGTQPGGDTIAQRITITNTGHAPMTGLTVIAPSLPWLFVSAGAATLAPGASTSLDLFINPGADVPYNVYADSIVLQSNAGTEVIPVDVEVTSAITGSVAFSVTDDMGFAVDGATVTLTLVESQFTAAAAAAGKAYASSMSGTTDADGKLDLSDILSGKYDVVIKAKYHDPLSYQLTVQPGTAAAQDANPTIPFVPYAFDWQASSSSDEATLGQINLGLTMTSEPTGHAALTPNKPAIEHFYQTTAGQDYVVLYSAGGSPADNYSRYYDVTKKTYEALVNNLGVDANNIYVFFGDGLDPAADQNAGTASSPQLVNSDHEFRRERAAGHGGLGCCRSLANCPSPTNDNFLFWSYDPTIAGDGLLAGSLSADRRTGGA